MDNPALSLKQALIDQIEAQGKKFLDENVGSREFIYERLDRISQLGVEFAAAADDAGRQALDLQMGAVRQSIENEMSTVAVNAAEAAREAFMNIVNQGITWVRVLLPILLAAIP